MDTMHSPVHCLFQITKSEQSYLKSEKHCVCIKRGVFRSGGGRRRECKKNLTSLLGLDWRWVWRKIA